MAQFNISGALTQKLFAEGDGGTISSIWFCNRHASDAVTIDLYIEKKLTGKFYLLKSVALPVGATLLYSDIVNIDNRKNQFSLFIKLTKGASETPTVDVIIS